MIIFFNLLAGTTGGQITRAKALLDNINIINPEVKIILLKNSYILSNYSNNDNLTIINQNLGKGKYKAIYRIIWENLKLPKIIKESNADIFLTFSHSLPFFKIDIPTIVGISNLAPFSRYALHEVDFFNRIKLLLLKKSILYSARKANLVIALSNTAKDILNKNGINDTKIYINHIGIDKFWFEKDNENTKETILKNFGIIKEYYLYVSHFYQYKNHLRLINAYNNLPEYIKNERQLIFVGHPHEQNYYSKLNDRINILNLEKNIIILPGISQNLLRILYQNTDLFIFPSLVENCPNILLEAMASNAPVITCNIEPMLEYCQNSAIYFDGLCEKNIEITIKNLYNAEDIKNEMKFKRDKLLLKYNWNSFISNILTEANKQIKLINT